MPSKLTALFCVLFLFVGATLHAQTKASQEEVFSRLTIGILQYVDWNDTEKTSPVRIGVYDKTIGRKYFFQFKKICDASENYELVELSNTKAANQNLDVAYIAGKGTTPPANLLSSLQNHSVLIVGEHVDILRSGGMIYFEASKRKNAEFTVNLKQAKAAGINIRSRLLNSAKEVIQ